MKRRDFVKIGTLLAASASAAHGFPNFNQKSKIPDQHKKAVNFIYDGSTLSPLEYAELLMKLADEGKIKTDYYSNGGIVEELEHKFAKWLGKENAVFMPTGTLANHIAIRKLAGTSKKAIVQTESHIYNDSGDCVQTLSGINLIPLGQDQIHFTLDEMKQSLNKVQSGRVETRVGVISIESPVRRKHDGLFGFQRMKAISDYARESGIKLHMDGARLFVESVHTNIPPLEYGQLFDTVYTSLYKCFNAPSGAILAGSKTFTQGLYHTRRMFGGGMPAVWPFAAVALQFVDDFIKEYTLAWENAENCFALLKKHGAFQVEKFPQGTHIVKLNINTNDPVAWRKSVANQNIQIRPPLAGEKAFLLKINPSFNRKTSEEVARIFIDAIG